MTASRTLAGGVVFFVRTIGSVVPRSWACFVLAFVDLRKITSIPSKYSASVSSYLRIGITELNRDIPHELVFKPDRLNPRYCLHHRRFSVRDVTNCSYGLSEFARGLSHKCIAM